MNAVPIEWGSAGQALPGERESGDRCVVRVAADQALLAVIDGIGHGHEAPAGRPSSSAPSPGEER